ncbi:hypothetical protein Tco_1016650 [Tanacetum coccineum]|uniref:Uncharacterized protein n=1 Tax=Tanacetum coccineum TaxID=301880 RepID=A0ABQ5FPF9_9ASTR
MMQVVGVTCKTKVKNLQFQMGHLTDMLSNLLLLIQLLLGSGTSYWQHWYIPKEDFKRRDYPSCWQRKKAITFKLDQTSKYTADYNIMTVNKNRRHDMACDEYSRGPRIFKTCSAYWWTPLLILWPIVLYASQLQPFGNSGFSLNERRKQIVSCSRQLIQHSSEESPNTLVKLKPLNLPLMKTPRLKSGHGSSSKKFSCPTRMPSLGKLSDNKGVVSRDFCTHNILMMRHYEPSVQSQRSSNCPKRSRKEHPSHVIRNFCLCLRMLLDYAMLLARFQRCMMAIFHDMIDKTMEDFSKLPFYDTFALKKRLRFVFSGMETLWSIPFNPHIKRKIFDCGSDLIAPTGLALNACGDASDFSIGWQSRAKEKTSIFKIYTMLARLYERGLLKARSCGGSYLLKNFDIEISRQKKELENLAADHLS